MKLQLQLRSKTQRSSIGLENSGRPSSKENLDKQTRAEMKNCFPFHIKSMAEIFDELSVIDESVKEEDRVVYLFAGLLECYSVLVTATVYW